MTLVCTMTLLRAWRDSGPLAGFRTAIRCSSAIKLSRAKTRPAFGDRKRSPKACPPNRTLSALAVVWSDRRRPSFGSISGGTIAGPLGKENRKPREGSLRKLHALMLSEIPRRWCRGLRCGRKGWRRRSKASLQLARPSPTNTLGSS